jgi:hypothetical protein
MFPVLSLNLILVLPLLCSAFLAVSSGELQLLFVTQSLLEGQVSVRRVSLHESTEENFLKMALLVHKN